MSEHRSIGRTIAALSRPVVGSMALAVGGLVLFRGVAPFEVLRKSNDVVGNYLQTLGSIYAVLLAFVMFVVWTQFNDARANVDREANELLDLFRTSRGLHQVEADAVVGHVQDPVARRPLPHDADRGSLRMLVHVLQCLLQHAVDGELLLRRHGGVAGVELARHLDAAPRLPLARVVAHRVGEAELGELGRTQVVDHRADRVERVTELSAQRSELAA